MQKMKLLLAGIAATLALIPVLITIAAPRVEAPGMFASSGVCLLVAIYYLRPKLWPRPSRFIIFPIVLGLISIPAVIVSRAFGRVDVFSLIFHAQFGIAGTDLKEYLVDIFEAVASMTLLVLLIYLFTVLLRGWRGVYILGALLIIVVNPFTRYGLQYSTRPIVESDLHLRLSDPVANEQSQRPDVIIIYLEGLERAFKSRQHFGDIYAPLEDYEARGLTLTNIAQIRGTGWSLAGLVATQCGVPLMPKGLRSRYGFESEVEFMPSLTCLGDWTQTLGYSNSFVVGGIEGFGGFKHFLETHSFASIVDKTVLDEMFSADEVGAASAGGVLDDQMVFDAARAIYDAKVLQDAPMMLVAETYGPHGNTSVLSRSCTDDQQARSVSDVPAAISCLLDHTVRFLDHVEATHNGRPTIVLLVSDHLNHDFTMNDIAPAGSRRNTVIMYTLGYESDLLIAGTEIDRPASMLDVYPTLLALAGLAGPDVSAGLGRSLLGPELTMVEEKGLARLNAELFPNPSLSDAIWQALPEP